MSRFGLLAITFFGIGGTLSAAAPDVKSVFPLGGAVGSTIEVSIAGTLTQPGSQVWTGSPGLSFEVHESGKTVKITVAKDVAPGLAWLRFFNAEGATGLLPFVMGSLPEVAEVEPNNQLSKPQTIAASSVINGKLGEGGDVDVFAISLKAGQTMVAAIDANWRLAMPVDAILQVVGPDGAVVEQNDDDHGNDPLIAVTATREGIWFVRVFGFPAAPDSSIRFAGGATYQYRLTLTTGAFANHPVPSVIQKGSDRRLKFVGWNIPDDAASATVEESVPVWFGRPGIANAVQLEEFAGPVLIEQQPSDLANPQELPIGAVVCGVIDQPGDEDVFRFKGTKGQKLDFDVDSRVLGHLLDPIIRIRSADQKVLVESDDSARKEYDPELKFTLPADGEYTIGIRDVFRLGGWRFAYRLFCRELKPAASLSVKADTFQLTADKPLEIPVTIARVEGYAEEISVGLQGLPEGVTCEPIVSTAKGDTSKEVKLVLKTDRAEPISGAFRVVGTNAKPDVASLVASFPMTVYRTSTQQLWLTVLKKPEAAAAK